MTKIHTYIYIVKKPDSSGVKNNKRQLSTLVKECGKHGLIDEDSFTINTQIQGLPGSMAHTSPFTKVGSVFPIYG